MRVKTLGLDHALAQQAKTTLIVVFGRVFLGALLGARWCWENPDLAVGKHAVYVEEDELDFLGAGFGHRTGILALSHSSGIDRALSLRRTFYETPKSG